MKIIEGHKVVSLASYFGGIGSAFILTQGYEEYNFFYEFNYEPREMYHTGTFELNFPSTKLIKRPELAVCAAADTEPDIIVGQPPCKRFSSLGMKNKNRHNFDPKESEYFDFLRFVNGMKPAFFILENLPKIKDFFEVKTGEILFKGKHLVSFPYTVKSYLLNALDFGVPQNRKRLFIIGSYEKEFNYSPPVYQHRIRRAFETECRWTLEDLDSLPEDATYNHEPVSHSIERVNGFIKLKPGESYYGTQNNRKLIPDKPAFTITSSKTHHVHYKYPRVLTVRERARLMGFPDSFKFVGKLTNQFDQTGCSIVPQITKDIIYQLVRFL